MNINPELVSAELVALLGKCGLPVGDISSTSPAQFFGIRVDSVLAAVVGLERYDHVGLLRSLAVLPSFRGFGLGKSLVSFAESHAASQGIDELFLLTTTAEKFFLGMGYVLASRSEAPVAIQATSEFTGLCPVSSAFLFKHLATGA